MDPVHGVTIHSLTEGVQSLYSYIQVESNRISLVVTGSGQTAGINVQGITNAINQSSVTISADRIDLRGYVTADSLQADIANLNYLETNGTLYAYGGVDTNGANVECGQCNADNVSADGSVSAVVSMDVAGKDVETELPYVTNVENISASGSSNVTLRFSLGSGNPIDVTFSRGGQASGVSLSAASNIRETQEGSGVWQADTTVSLNGTTATKTLDVTAAISRGYALGWAAARARSAFAWSGANENVLTINRPGATVDTSDTAVVYSISSYKASGDTLVNSAANYFTYNGRVYTTVTPQNDPDHPGMWTPSTANVSKTQYINVGQ